jgi:hypothetical protein
VTLQRLLVGRTHSVRPIPQCRFSAEFAVKVELIRKVFLIDKIGISQSRWRIIGRAEFRVNISWEEGAGGSV